MIEFPGVMVSLILLACVNSMPLNVRDYWKGDLCTFQTDAKSTIF